MEKEMKKMLLVAVSVGVFLLITITVAILLLTPKAGTEETAFSSSYPYPASRTQPVAENSDNVQTQDFVPDTNINLNRDSSIVNISGDRNNGDSLTISIPKPSAIAVPDTAGTQHAASVQTSKVSSAVQTSAAVSSRTVTAAAVQTTPAARQTAVPASATRQTTTARSINDFWVQTGAFSAMVRAEDAKEMLASKGITSIIENRMVDGKLWYRVRLGPYTSENEANYWLALVQSIDGFTESQIRHTVRQQ